MRTWLSLILIALATQADAVGELRWPNPQIAVPPEVQRFIVAECHYYKATSDETVDACIRGEGYGYRAVVMMLMDEEDGERAAERYRACRAGLGALGGRFHRRRAECIGGSLGYVWRFEFSRRAALGSDLSGPVATPPTILAEQAEYAFN